MHNDYRLNLASMLAESSPQQAIEALCEVIAELQDKLSERELISHTKPKPQFVLFLNDMRFPHVETTVPAFRADHPRELVAFLEGEKVDHYWDGQWGKTHRQGGPLEWFNPPFEGDLVPGPSCVIGRFDSGEYDHLPKVSGAILVEAEEEFDDE